MVLQQAYKLQKRTAGWSRGYQLTWCEKYWLDPQLAKLNGEEQFHSALTQQDWISDVEQRFAAWLNALLKKRFPNIRTILPLQNITNGVNISEKNYIDNYAAYIRRYYELSKLLSAV
ncbi:hypothetical protein HMPREF0027_1553 [Actinobacillus ureae ATCC 25976]|uniref:Uncharacterized protein n=1 Tax=Actinobacillus ureae ATCC 25976 TaxID=887324 RepID=E8KI86_9PAST|nr:hypothetical protein HMPREF0027_1553 [Actinobacillus ureae ATCC 25976]